MGFSLNRVDRPLFKQVAVPIVLFVLQEFLNELRIWLNHQLLLRTVQHLVFASVCGAAMGTSSLFAFVGAEHVARSSLR